MYRVNLVKIITLLLLTVTISVNAQHEASKSAQVEKSHSEEGGDFKAEIHKDIRHHVKDAYEFVFFSNSKTGTHYGFSLPVILIDNGLHVFMASKFNQGESLVHIGGAYYKLYHSKIYKTDASGEIHYNEKHFVSNEKPLDLSITKGVVSIFIVGVLLFLIFTSLAKSYVKNGAIPKGIGRFFEPIVLYVRDEIAIPNIGEEHYKKYMSYLLTIFFFIWFSNLLGLTPFGINITGNIAVTFVLALFTFVITQFSGNKNYWKHIFWMPGVPTPMKIILAPIELLGVFIKPFALMIRLYANMSAGHIVIYSLLGLMFIFHSIIGSSFSFILAFLISILELLVAILQAYIFTILSALYFGFAVEEHAEEH
ncbi:F0F1 ATP synthase subunit A [Lutibacter sp. B1]|uniref:F0F1 ATP synthase subunit A n=1 Tax=Lutibacter sp. B1 TaxID=2725996 RepID=UPI0014578D70|nr:F0F1 ATP synthase subunit A [Lutibacter sp. B1]NLP57226.1 F0F1 ATP synthase subunit A [Lutibacter sp. B1]